MVEEKLIMIDIGDIEDFINKIGTQFNLTFAPGEFENIDNLEELFDAILRRIELENVDDCTTQQSFYKLRRALVESGVVDSVQDISPSTRLDSIFPDKRRISNVNRVEKELGVKLSIFCPNRYLEVVLWLSVLISFLIMFFDWKIGLLSLFVLGACLDCIYRTARNLSYTTIHDIMPDLLVDNYLKLRRDKRTVNKVELKGVWKTEFAYALDSRNGRFDLVRF